MSRRPKFKIPKVTVPPTKYLVTWIDANHELEYDGPAADFQSELVKLPYIGFHTKTERDHIVLSGEAAVEDGETQIRFNMTMPTVHVLSMDRLLTKEEWNAEAQAEKAAEA